MNKYTEDNLVEQPAIKEFQKLGWDYLNCYDEPRANAELGRETSGEVVLKPRLKEALTKLNPNLGEKEIDLAVKELAKDRSSENPVEANKTIHEFLKSGVKIKYETPEGEQTVEVARVVDWENPENNDYLLTSQLWITGDLYKRRADLIGFVNGFPLVFVELKAAHKNLKNAFDDNLTDYKDAIPQLFWYNSFIIISNGSESLVGTFTSGYEHFAEWKRISGEEEKGRVSLETIIKGTCEKKRFLDLIENFTLFSDIEGAPVKILAKNHQYLGVNNSVKAFQEAQGKDGKVGVFWHTQGSGKSYSMAFFTQKVLRKVPGNWTFVIVTDRVELDKQIYQNFANAGLVTEGEKYAHAASRKDLSKMLKEDHRFLFTTIHKFEETGDVISERNDIIVMTDEAHRSQYDVMALNMRNALPNANFIGFTGTPLIVGEEKTKEVFGDYVSKYNFSRSIKDGNTVPLYYENRIPELQIVNENFNEEMEALLDRAELNPEDEDKLVRKFKLYHLITREERLNRISKDIVEHFINRGFFGKAMVVSVDKLTATKMYEKVKVYLPEYKEKLENKLISANSEEKADLESKIKKINDFDMAVVVSPGQNEIAKMKEGGVDIRPHRERFVKEGLEKKFKDPKDPLQLVFVCAMWMTGFDVPSCSTIYLDKPMKNHTLMQTIARANRVFPKKNNGLIVDYIGIFRNLQKALAIYGDVKGIDSPIQDKSKLLDALREKIEETREFLIDNGVDLRKIVETDGFDEVALIANAVENLVVTEELKKKYLGLAHGVNMLFKAILPDKKANEFKDERKAITVIADKIKSLEVPTDLSEVMRWLEDLLDKSVATEEYVINEPGRKYGNKVIDINKIDFKKIEKKMREGNKHTQVEKLKNLLGSKLFDMVEKNRTREQLFEKFEKLIEEYNSSSKNIDEIYEKLKKFTEELEEEEKRHIKEGLSEEELAVFDILMKPAPELSEKEVKQVKKAARELLLKLKKERLSAIDWRKKQQSRAAVQVEIESVLDKDLPEKYDRDLFSQKVRLIFNHVFDSYFGQGKSIYN